MTPAVAGHRAHTSPHRYNMHVLRPVRTLQRRTARHPDALSHRSVVLYVREKSCDVLADGLEHTSRRCDWLGYHMAIISSRPISAIANYTGSLATMPIRN